FKGFESALQAFSLFQKKYNCKILIAGKTKPNQIQEILKQNDILNKNNIEYLGFLDAQSLVEVYSECFCLLHPSYMDNSPNSICEAQIAGLPVIASKVGGVPSLIKDEDTGLLCNLHPDEIFKLMEKIYLDEDLWYHISVRSRHESRLRHNPENIISDTLMAYQTISSIET
ncbi:glycosyltransferase family 4 protein, partial [Bacteroidota bacterium]